MVQLYCTPLRAYCQALNFFIPLYPNMNVRIKRDKARRSAPSLAPSRAHSLTHSLTRSKAPGSGVPFPRCAPAFRASPPAAATRSTPTLARSLHAYALRLFARSVVRSVVRLLGCSFGRSTPAFLLMVGKVKTAGGLRPPAPPALAGRQGTCPQGRGQAPACQGRRSRPARQG